MRTRKRVGIGHKFRNIVHCLGSEDQANDKVIVRRSFGEAGRRPDPGDVEEAESSLRESGPLNYEEARALLGRYEYQRGNAEAALQVFQEIDINAVTPKIKVTLSRRTQSHSPNDDDLPMSIRAASVLLEAMFLKAKSLRALSRYFEAAQSCKVILDVVESSSPDGLPENFGPDCKLQETLSKAVQLLPELWQLASCPGEVIASYRRALLHHWNLDDETTAKIQKDFAIYLLYSGNESTSPPKFGSETLSYMPKNNLEEAILLLVLLLRKANRRMAVWDPAILDHLSFALSVAGLPRSLASLVEELLPGIVERKQRYHTLALCYYGDGDSFAALNLLRKLLASRDDEPVSVSGLFLASKICGEFPEFAEEGVGYAQRALDSYRGRCNQMGGTANFLLGMSLSEYARLAVSFSDRITRQSEANSAFERAGNLTGLRDPEIVYQLSLQYAEERRLDRALYYAEELLKLESGLSLKGWLLMVRILSARKEFSDAETIIDAALEQTDKWDQGELLRTKAKIQVVQGRLKDAINTYAHLVAVLQLQNKRSESAKGATNGERGLEYKTWHDLAHVYISLSRWNDAEACVSKSRAINPHSASELHIHGSVDEAKGRFKEALEAYTVALSIDPNHVPSLISSAVALTHLSNNNERSFAVRRSFLMQALSLDRVNHKAWYQLGLLYKAQGGGFIADAVDCFQAATLLQDTAPVEPFR